ncbi:MAG: FkbM family methyltransferase [Cyanobacteriota bacterium]|nr:FkbM family methyltransferase [Cyanobacteriota bacterium]
MTHNRFAIETLNYIWNHPNCRQEQLQAIARFIGWQFYKRLTHRSLDIPLVDDLKLRCYPDSAAASAVLYCGLFDRNEMTFLLRYLREEDAFLDLGANIGVYTLLAASKIDSGKIYSIEALPKNYARLQENIALNQLHQVTSYDSAIADRVGTVRLELAEGDCMPHLVEETEIAENAIAVPCETLNHLFNNKPPSNLKLAKMDIEGAELLALKGATSLLEQHCPPVWLVEIVYQDRELVEWFENYGYTLYEYSAETHQLSPVSLGCVSGKNVLAIATSALEFVRHRLSR